ncbi:MAG: hypothetical protein Kow0025_10480 [Thermodesulfovibrionales bacterium]
MEGIRRLNTAAAAGALGGLVNGLALWLLGALGITAAMGVALAPMLTPQFLYPRVAWGGIWGVIFLLPVLRDSVFWRGVVMSFGPTLVMLFVVFPFRLQKGMLGLEVGALTPVFVIVLNVIWGVTAAWWIRLSEGPAAH